VLKVMNTSAIQTERERSHWRKVLAAAQSDQRIRVIDRILSGSEMAALTELCDCYLSLHRSEGFGLGPAEAMVRGKPVIVTGYSGVTDFCTPSTALLVDYSLVPLEPGTYPYMDAGRTYHWAEPSLEMASKHMRALYESPESGREMGRRARALMREQYSIAALSRRYRSRLSDLGFMN
jgi:glycosyltransferase involved in cell wall biosynthesis